MSGHPSFGPVPENVFRDAMQKPFGEATRELRKFVPTFGRKTGELIKYAITCSREVIRREVATVIVEAEDEDAARAQVTELDDGEFDWDETGDEDERNFEINSVKVAPDKS